MKLQFAAVIAVFGLAVSNTTTVRAADPKVVDKCVRASALVLIDQGAWNPTSGSGTLIEIPAKAAKLFAADEAAMITAAHVAARVSRKGSVRVRFLVPNGSSELAFGPQIEARVIEWAEPGEGDVALLAIKKGSKGLPTPVAWEMDVPKLTEQSELLLVGCPGGKKATVHTAYPLQLNKQKGGGHHIIIGAAREGGHSGGGCFDAAGSLIAVCSGHPTFPDPNGTSIGFGLYQNDGRPVVPSNRRYRGLDSIWCPSSDMRPMLDRLEKLPGSARVQSAGVQASVTSSARPEGVASYVSPSQAQPQLSSRERADLLAAKTELKQAFDKAETDHARYAIWKSMTELEKKLGK